jgi:hypothetical protein
MAWLSGGGVKNGGKFSKTGKNTKTNQKYVKKETMKR